MELTGLLAVIPNKIVKDSLSLLFVYFAKKQPQSIFTL